MTELSTEKTAPGSPDPSRNHPSLRMGFALYLALLTWIVVWKLEVPTLDGGALPQLKLVPFVATDVNGASRPAEVVANLLLFLPFGLYAGVLVPARRLGTAVAAIAGTSLLLEAAQYAFAVGSSDVTDLISNTTGGLVGLGIAIAAGRGRGHALLGRICVLGTTVLGCACLAFFASPLHYR